jgi:hypothetical protein
MYTDYSFDLERCKFIYFHKSKTEYISCFVRTYMSDAVYKYAFIHETLNGQ